MVLNFSKQFSVGSGICVSIDDDLISISAGHEDDSDYISFRSKNSIEMYQYFVDNIEATFQKMFSNKNDIEVYSKILDESEENEKRISKMSKEDLIKYIKNGETKLADCGCITLTQEQENTINNSIARMKYPNGLHWFLVDDKYQTENVFTSRYYLHKLNVIECETLLDIKKQDWLNFITANLTQINTFLKENKFRFLYKFTIKPYYLYKDTIIGKLVIQGK